MQRPIIPVRIIWTGPESTEVHLDEDGVMLRFGKGGLEESDVDRLLAIIAVAKAAKASGSYVLKVSEQAVTERFGLEPEEMPF